MQGAGAYTEERPTKAAGVHDELLTDGSMVLYHAGTRRLMTLNPTAALIWECCDGVRLIPQIAAEVRELFPEIANVEGDVRVLLQELRAEGMIVPEGT